MKSLIALALVASAIACTAVPAAADERMNDAALGAGSGLLVGGPVGLVAGGVIGYVAGPDIRRGMGVHHRHHYQQRRAYRSARSVQ